MRLVGVLNVKKGVELALGAISMKIAIFDRNQWVYLLMLVLLIAIFSVASIGNEFSKNDLLSALSTLFSTFIGATLAFRLNLSKEKKENEAKNISSINKALFTMLRQRNALVNYQKDFLNFVNKYELAFNMNPESPPNYDDLVHDFHSFEFLLSTKDVDVVFRILIEQERFQQAIKSINERNRFYIEEVYPAVNKASINGKRTKAEDLEGLLGEKAFKGALIGAESMLNHVNATVKSLTDIHKELYERAKEIFPGCKFVSY